MKRPQDSDNRENVRIIVIRSPLPGNPKTKEWGEERKRKTKRRRLLDILLNLMKDQQHRTPPPTVSQEKTARETNADHFPNKSVRYPSVLSKKVTTRKKDV